VIRYSSQAVIDRAPSEVFEALLDPNRYPEWTDMTDMTFDDGIHARVGARGRFRLANGPIKGMLDFEVTELVPDRRVVFRITHPSLTWTAYSDLAPDGAGTRFTYSGEMAIHGWRRILEPMAKAELARGEAKELERFKAMLETAPAAAVAG